MCRVSDDGWDTRLIKKHVNAVRLYVLNAEKRQDPVVQCRYFGCRRHACSIAPLSSMPRGQIAQPRITSGWPNLLFHLNVSKIGELCAWGRRIGASGQCVCALWHVCQCDLMYDIIVVSV